MDLEILASAVLPQELRDAIHSSGAACSTSVTGLDRCTLGSVLSSCYPKLMALVWPEGEHCCDIPSADDLCCKILPRFVHLVLPFMAVPDLEERADALHHSCDSRRVCDVISRCCTHDMTGPVLRGIMEDFVGTGDVLYASHLRSWADNVQKTRKSYALLKARVCRMSAKHGQRVVETLTSLLHSAVELCIISYNFRYMLWMNDIAQCEVLLFILKQTRVPFMADVLLSMPFLSVRYTDISCVVRALNHLDCTHFRALSNAVQHGVVFDSASVCGVRCSSECTIPHHEEFIEQFVREHSSYEHASQVVHEFKDYVNEVRRLDHVRHHMESSLPECVTRTSVLSTKTNRYKHLFNAVKRTLRQDARILGHASVFHLDPMGYSMLRALLDALRFPVFADTTQCEGAGHSVFGRINSGRIMGLQRERCDLFNASSGLDPSLSTLDMFNPYHVMRTCDKEQHVKCCTRRAIHFIRATTDQLMHV